MLTASTTLLLAAAPAMSATNVDINIGVPGVYVPPPVVVQPQPVVVQSQPVYVEREDGYWDCKKDKCKFKKYKHHKHHDHDDD